MNLKKENAWNMQIVIKYADKKIDGYILEQFNKEVVSFGRQPDNDIILDLDFISRIHGVFFMEDGTWYVQDLDSTNGLLVNGTYIDQPYAIKEGDCICIQRKDGEESISIYISESEQAKLDKARSPKKLVIILSVICVLLAALIVSLIIYATHRDSSKKETATPTDASTETEEATETEEPTTVTTIEAETTMEEVEETTEETTEETVTTEAVQNAVSETDFPVENSVGGLSYSEAAKDQDQHFFVEHNDCYYPMTNSECFDENMVSLKIRFVGENFEYAQVHVGDKIVGFDGMHGFKSISIINSEGYSVPQEFVTNDDGTVEFHKSSFNSSLYYGKCFITTNKIFKINDEDANRIADYVEIGDGWPTYKFLYYAEPTNIEVTYYKNYEQVVKTVSVDKKCFLLGDKYKADYQEAPEGYFYYDTSNLPLGKYVINAMAGVQFAIEVVE